MNQPKSPEEKEHESPKYETWPVSASDTRPVNRGTVGGRPVFTILRIVIWLLPTIVVPFVVFACSTTLSQVGAYMVAPLICWTAALIAVAALGYFYYRIALQQKGIEIPRENKK
jgi:hypothetical protein